MSERYTKLFALPENLYSVGAPVVIAAGALQKDNQAGKVFAQLKIRNIQDKAIKAATVKIVPFDTAGKPLGGAVDYQYLDLSAERDTDFGQKVPVMLPNAATRSFSVSVEEVIYSDNSTWTGHGETWEPLSAPVPLEKALEDGELAKQYRIKHGADCKCIFKKEKDLWRCACGALNHDGETNCHSCQREAATLAALNVDELKAERDKRFDAERKKKRKTKKLFVFGILTVIVVITAMKLISNLLEAQREEAAKIFMQTDYYKAWEEVAEESTDDFCAVSYNSSNKEIHIDFYFETMLKESGIHIMFNKIPEYYDNYDIDVSEMIEPIAKQYKEQFSKLDGYDPDIPIVCTLCVASYYPVTLWETVI